MFPTTAQQPSATQYGLRPRGVWPRIALLTTTGASSWTDPAGVSKVRAYAFGPGGTGVNGGQSGGGGGCAYGDIDVLAGQAIQCFIATGDSQGATTFGSWLKANGASTDGTNKRLGGTAWKAGSVENGGAYTGGNGSTAYQSGGASSGSPLGNGVNSLGSNSGGSGWGGDGSGGGGGGVGGGGEYSWATVGGRGGGSGPSFKAAPPGTYTDPLLALCDAPGSATTTWSSSFGVVALYGVSGGLGAGGSSPPSGSSSPYPVYGGHGGLGGGGAGSNPQGAASSSTGGTGGIGGGGGCATNGSTMTGGAGGYGGGGGSTGSGTPGAGGQGCIIIFY